MKKIILFVSVIFLLVSCENKGTNIPTSDSINVIKIIVKETSKAV